MDVTFKGSFLEVDRKYRKFPDLIGCNYFCIKIMGSPCAGLTLKDDPKTRQRSDL